MISPLSFLLLFLIHLINVFRHFNICYEKGIKDKEKKLEEDKEHILKCRKTFIKCIRNNNEKDKGEIIEIKSHLAEVIKPGDIYLGYDLRTINILIIILLNLLIKYLFLI